MKITDKQLQRWRAREEFKLELLKTIRSFKSKEEPKVKLVAHDVMIVLSEMLHSGLIK